MRYLIQNPMNLKSCCAALTLLSLLCFNPSSRADDIAATGSGEWGSTEPDAPWPDGIVPGTNDSVYIVAPFNVTVSSNATIAFIDGSGTVTLGPDATLNVLGDPAGAYGTQTLGSLDTSAPGNTVNYHGNAFWAKRQNYYNLVFSGAGDFFNGDMPGSDAVPMTIAGDMLVSGTNIALQQGADFTINGNLLLLGATNKWDCSSFNLTVTSNTVIQGSRNLLFDGNGALGSNYFNGDLTVGSNVLAWNISDVTQWGIGGSLTNQGLIAGKGYGSISFNGVGVITGKPIKIPTLTVNGTYTIDTTITLTTNTPTLNGTLVFDLAATNQLILQSYPTNPLTLYYSGGLTVINSGVPPAAGSTHKFFNATNYDGAFAFTNFPSLPSGLSVADHLLSNGSITVVGNGPGAPILNASREGNLLTLSWDSTTFTGYRIQAQTNALGLGTTWSETGSGTVSPFSIAMNPTNPPVFFRLSNQ